MPRSSPRPRPAWPPVRRYGSCTAARSWHASEGVRRIVAALLRLVEGPLRRGPRRLEDLQEPGVELTEPAVLGLDAPEVALDHDQVALLRLLGVGRRLVAVEAAHGVVLPLAVARLQHQELCAPILVGLDHRADHRQLA